MLRRTLSFALTALFACSIAELAPAQTLNGRLASIAASRTIKIAHRTDAIPFSFVDDNKNVTGFTVDLCKLVAQAIEKQLKVEPLKIEWTPVTSQTRFDAVSSGSADMECGSSTVTLARMKQVDFSNYVFIETTGVVGRTASNIRSLKDLAGKKVVVIAGTSNERVINQVIRQMQLNATIIPVKDRDEATAVLGAGNADAFASDKLLLVGTKFRNNEPFYLLPDDLSIEPYAIVLPRGDADLRLAVNSALAGLYRSGEALKLFEKWFAPVGLQPGPVLTTSYMLSALDD